MRRTAAGSNPRPVRVDEQGRLYELNGEPIVVPGLEPEVVRAGLEDIRMGRVRSLDAIQAGRGQ